MEPISFVQSRTLYCSDNLEQLVDFPSECVDLIYLDPPFFSNRHYEVIWETRPRCAHLKIVGRGESVTTSVG